MKKDVAIEIKGIYIQNGEEDRIDLFTVGSYYKRKGSYYIAYDETEMTGYKGSRTVLQLDSEKRITLTRSGTTESQLIVERGVRHQCNYDTGFGTMTIGVTGDLVVSSLKDCGGKLEFAYSLDVNTALESENSVCISVSDLIQ